MNIIKKIWLFLHKRYVNSKSHVFVSYILEKLKFEGFHISYSQFGEDLIMENYLRDIKNGFFVDVGCNRPIEGNNTFKFYLKGWSGINIDGNQKMIDAFNSVRAKDINLCEIVSNKVEKTKFFISNDDRVSSLSNDFIDEMDKSRSYDDGSWVMPKTLEEILDNHLPKGKEITVLNVDVEGHDMEVIKSNNFEKYSPLMICIEDHNFNVSTITKNEICIFLQAQGYEIAGFSKPNIFFRKSTV